MTNKNKVGLKGILAVFTTLAHIEELKRLFNSFFTVFKNLSLFSRYLDLKIWHYICVAWLKWRIKGLNLRKSGRKKEHKSPGKFLAYYFVNCALLHFHSSRYLLVSTVFCNLNIVALTILLLPQQIYSCILR